ncbi:hypothetical protein ARALYDRAFT_331145 [Arabidopsis lyrata subsp. lyrata]|uniref:Uncharacterized protein n=1 Tax=Arabidopsis lyrata subsp. lyrata TaxID=81972 RepID=D7MS40_ARALL|nr:hypothetical protein ARALYDRAFT_331145 [Arabidopsis lyrata subsp. lyrata]
MTSSMVSSMVLFLLLLLVFPHMDKALGAQEEAQKQNVLQDSPFVEAHRNLVIDLTLASNACVGVLVSYIVLSFVVSVLAYLCMCLSVFIEPPL